MYNDEEFAGDPRIRTHGLRYWKRLDRAPRQTVSNDYTSPIEQAREAP